MCRCIVPNVYDMCEQLIRVHTHNKSAPWLCVRALFFEVMQLVAVSDDISWHGIRRSNERFGCRVDISKGEIS